MGEDMATGYGKLTQSFRIKIDTTKLQEFILDKLAEEFKKEKDFDYVDFDESYLDDNDIVINGDFKCHYKSTYYPQTMESPEEYDEDRPYITDYFPGVLNDILPSLKELLEVEVEEDDDDVEYEPDEYDPPEYGHYKDED